MTPFVIPCLYAVMVPLDAHISDTSTNPARTVGPALIPSRWDGWWIYWVGPMIGTLAAVIASSSIAKRIEVAEGRLRRCNNLIGVGDGDRTLCNAFI